MQRLPEAPSDRKTKASRSFNDVAWDLLNHEPHLSSRSVRVWLGDVVTSNCLSLLDEVVLRAMARACGVAEW